jgi:hypothetical protein
LSGYRKNVTEREALTSWRQQSEGLVRKQKENDQQRGTHQLETAEAGTCQDTKRKRQGEEHSPTRGRSGRDKSGHRKKAAERGETHQLESAEGETCQDMERKQPRKGHLLPGDHRGTCQDMERKRPSEGYSLSGDGRRRNLSGHGKKPTKRGALTLWRQQR